MNMYHTKPVNKQAGIFLSRKNRVEDLKQALEIFANQLIGPDVSCNISDLLKQDDGDNSELVIRLKIRKDATTPGHFVASVETTITRREGAMTFYGLKP